MPILKLKRNQKQVLDFRNIKKSTSLKNYLKYSEKNKSSTNFIHKPKAITCTKKRNKNLIKSYSENGVKGKFKKKLVIRKSCKANQLFCQSLTKKKTYSFPNVLTGKKSLDNLNCLKHRSHLLFYDKTILKKPNLSQSSRHKYFDYNIENKIFAPLNFLEDESIRTQKTLESLTNRKSIKNGFKSSLDQNQNFENFERNHKIVEQNKSFKQKMKSEKNGKSILVLKKERLPRLRIKTYKAWPKNSKTSYKICKKSIVKNSHPKNEFIGGKTEREKNQPVQTGQTIQNANMAILYFTRTNNNFEANFAKKKLSNNEISQIDEKYIKSLLSIVNKKQTPYCVISEGIDYLKNNELLKEIAKAQRSHKDNLISGSRRVSEPIKVPSTINELNCLNKMKKRFTEKTSNLPANTPQNFILKSDNEVQNTSKKDILEISNLEANKIFNCKIEKNYAQNIKLYDGKLKQTDSIAILYNRGRCLSTDEEIRKRNIPTKSANSAISFSSCSTDSDSQNDFANLGIASYRNLKKIVEEEVCRISKNYIQKIKNNKTNAFNKNKKFPNIDNKYEVQKNQKQSQTSALTNSQKLVKNIKDVTENTTIEINTQSQCEKSNTKPYSNDNGEEYNPKNLIHKSTSEATKENLKLMAKEKEEKLTNGKCPREIVKNWCILHRLQKAFLALGTPCLHTKQLGELKKLSNSEDINMVKTKSRNLKKKKSTLKHKENEENIGNGLKKNNISSPVKSIDKFFEEKMRQNKIIIENKSHEKKDGKTYETPLVHASLNEKKQAPKATEDLIIIKSKRDTALTGLTKKQQQNLKIKNNSENVETSLLFCSAKEVAECRNKTFHPKIKTFSNSSFEAEQRSLISSQKSWVKLNSKIVGKQNKGNFSKKNKNLTPNHYYKSFTQTSDYCKSQFKDDENKKSLRAFVCISPNQDTKDTENYPYKKKIVSRKPNEKVAQLKSKNCLKYENNEFLYMQQISKVLGEHEKYLNMISKPKIIKKDQTEVLKEKNFSRKQSKYIFYQPINKEQKKASMVPLNQSRRCNKAGTLNENLRRTFPKEKETCSGNSKAEVKEFSTMLLSGNEFESKSILKNLRKWQKNVSKHFFVTNDFLEEYNNEKLNKSERRKFRVGCLFHSSSNTSGISTTTYTVQNSEEFQKIFKSKVNNNVSSSSMSTYSTNSLMQMELNIPKSNSSQQPLWEHDIKHYHLIVKDIISQYKRISGFLKQSEHLDTSKINLWSADSRYNVYVPKKPNTVDISEYRRKIISEYQTIPIFEYKSRIKGECMKNNVEEMEVKRNLQAVRTLRSVLDFDVKDFQPKVQKILDSQQYVDSKLCRKKRLSTGKPLRKQFSLQEIFLKNSKPNKHFLKERQQKKSISQKLNAFHRSSQNNSKDLSEFTSLYY